MRAANLLICFISVCTWACRQSPAPFEAADREPLTGDVRRLTFSPGQDRAPAWNLAGDLVYYSGSAFDQSPATGRRLLALPKVGGAALPLLPNVQASSSVDRLLVTAVRPQDQKRIAYTELWSVLPNWIKSRQAGVRCTPPELTTSNVPTLNSVMLRVRKPGIERAISEDPTVLIELPGREFDTTRHPLNKRGIYVLRLYPFHRIFNNTRSYIFRPSWAPDGERLVFSNGIRLFVWELNSGLGPQPIEGTQDGVWPAWSPDGDWIAFTHLERADSTALMECHRLVFGAVIAVTERRDYIVGEHILTLVRPDGSELIELGEGNEPAWSPEGETLYFRRDGMIWRMRIPDGIPESVPGTERGREPAVSPSGKYLAFTRPMNDGDHDIWVAALERQPPGQ